METDNKTPDEIATAIQTPDFTEASPALKRNSTVVPKTIEFEAEAAAAKAVETTPAVELADDGSPLGTLRVDGKIYAKDAMGELKKVAETELARSRSFDITGDTDADEGLVELYEGYEDKDKRRHALVRYVRDGLTARQVANELKVPERTVLMWAYHGKWNRAATRELSVRMEEEARALVNLRLENRERLLVQQIKDSEKMQRKLMRKVEDDEVSMKSAAEALAALAKIQNSAMGVADTGAVVTDPKQQEEKDGKGGSKVLVAVFPGMSGIPTLGKKEEVIDVKVD